MNAESSSVAAFRALADALVVVDRLRLRSWEAQDLTITQLRLLALLRDCDGLTNAEAGRLLNVRPSSITRICDRLIERGLVAKLPGLHDRRSVQLAITADGVQAVRAIHANAREFLDGAFGRMTPDDLAMLAGGLRAFRDAVSAEDLPRWWSEVPPDEGTYRGTGKTSEAHDASAAESAVGMCSTEE